MTVKLNFFRTLFQAAAFFLGCFGPWEKVSKEIAAGIILVCCQFGQHIRQIFVDPETVCFCSLYQSVHDGTSAPRVESTLPQFLRPRVKERMARSAVLLSMGTGRTGDIPPSSDCTGVPCRAVSGGDFWKRFFYPREISVNFWRDLTLTVIFPVFILGFIVKPVQVEQLGDQLHTLCGNDPLELGNTGSFYEFRILLFRVNPTAGNLQVILLLF